MPHDILCLAVVTEDARQGFRSGHCDGGCPMKFHAQPPQWRTQVQVHAWPPQQRISGKILGLVNMTEDAGQGSRPGH